MSTEHVVVPVAPCTVGADHFIAEYCDGEEHGCPGCLGGRDGRRALLDQAVPVAFGKARSDEPCVLVSEDGVELAYGSTVPVWVEVQS